MKALIFFIIGTFLLGSGAIAAPKKKKVTTPSATMERPDVVVSVPHSELDIPEVPKEVSPPATIEIGSSTYTPKQFVRGTYSSGSSAFERGKFPFVTINRLGEITSREDWRFLWKAGIFANSIERSLAVPAGSGTRIASQNLNFLGLRAGTELQSPSVWRSRAFIGLSALPLFALSAAGQVEGSVSEFALAGELVGGILIQPEFLDEFWGFRRGGLALSAHHIQGKVKDSNLKNTGVLAAFRLDL